MKDLLIEPNEAFESMMDIDDFFEDESYPAGEFGRNLQVVPLVDAKRIAVDYANQFKPKWIPVGENLPVNNKHVLLRVFDLHLGRKIDIGGYDSIYNHWDDQLGNKIEIVTHWCPMPS